MKTKLKIIIPAVIAIIAIAAVLFIGTPADVAPADISALMTTAQQYLVENNYEQAIAEFEKILELDPMNVDAYLGLAEAYRDSGDIDKAVEILEKGYELTGDGRIKALLDGLNGAVVEETETSTAAVSETETEVTTTVTAPENEIVKNDDGSYYEMAFNTDGKIIHEDFYNEDGSSFGSADVEYYPDGNKKNETYYRADGTYYIKEYRADGKVIKKTNYNADGSIYFYELYEYDANNNLISDTSYYGDDSLRGYTKYKYDSNNYIIFQESYDSLIYRKETFTDEYLWEERTYSWNIKYNDDYSIAYTYPIDDTESTLQYGGHNGIKECYGYYSDTADTYSHIVYEFNSEGDLILSYSYNNFDNTETLFGYEEYFHDDKGNQSSSKSYYKNYETGQFELSHHFITVLDGLGNMLTYTGYNKDGSIYSQYKY